MHTYFCNNCDYKIGYFNNITKYFTYNNCDYIKSKNNNTIYFLDCKNCKKFVGIFCYDVCKTCFGENQIYEEENLYKWFLKYKKIKNYNYFCEICNKDTFRYQNWFFEELTFINNI